MKAILKLISGLLLIFYLPGTIFPQVDSSGEFFSKIRNAYRTISYKGDIRIEQFVGNRKFVFTKRVWVKPPDRYIEKIIDFPRGRFKWRNRNLPFFRRKRAVSYTHLTLPTN